jgi:hypothetical protein
MATLKHFTNFEDLKNSKVSNNPVPSDKTQSELKEFLALLSANSKSDNTTVQQSNPKKGGK